MKKPCKYKITVAGALVTRGMRFEAKVDRTRGQKLRKKLIDFAVLNRLLREKVQELRCEYEYPQKVVELKYVEALPAGYTASGAGADQADQEQEQELDEVTPTMTETDRELDRLATYFSSEEAYLLDDHHFSDDGYARVAMALGLGHGNKSSGNYVGRSAGGIE